jgi:hypothetical protein
MYNVYVSRNGDLLVVPVGTPLPLNAGRGWRKRFARKSVSAEIKATIQAVGFFRRKTSHAPIARKRTSKSER